MPSTKSQPAPPPALDGASSVFADVLGAEEKLLWQSRAGSGAYALAHVRAVFMGVTLFIVAVAWNAVVLKNNMMPELGLVAWVFAALGLAYVLMPLMAFIKAKWFLFYALTDERLIILQLYPKHRLDSFPLKTVNRVVPHHVNLGNGTLLIDAPGAVSKNPTAPRAGFYGVRYVKQLAEAVETLKNPEAALNRPAPKPSKTAA